MCCLSGAFFTLPEPWAWLLILPGFPHFGNLSGSAWFPGKGSGTRDVLSPPGQLGVSLPPCQSTAHPGSVPHPPGAPGAPGRTGHRALPASALLFCQSLLMLCREGLDPADPIPAAGAAPTWPQGWQRVPVPPGPQGLTPFQGLGPEKQNSWWEPRCARAGPELRSRPWAGCRGRFGGFPEEEVPDLL